MKQKSRIKKSKASPRDLDPRIADFLARRNEEEREKY